MEEFKEQTPEIRASQSGDTQQTTNKKVLTIKLAKWWRRLLNFFIDLIIVSSIFNIIIALYSGYNIYSIVNQNASYDYYNGDRLDSETLTNLRLFIKWGLLLTMLVYYLIMELTVGRTIGKLFTNTIVLDIDTNKKTTAERIIGRTLCRFIPFDMFSFLSSSPYGWHDTLSGTYVTTLEDKRFHETNSYGVSHLSLISKYYFTDILNKGYRRLLIVGSLILPLVYGIILYNKSGRLIEGYEDKYGYYDENEMLAGFILGFFFYWLIYFLGVWIYRGFKDEKKPS